MRYCNSSASYGTLPSYLEDLSELCSKDAVRKLQLLVVASALQALPQAGLLETVYVRHILCSHHP